MKSTHHKSYSVGLAFGKFYPLHSGHIFMIEKAASQVDELHVILGCEAERDLKLFQESNLPKQPMVKDRFLWLQETFKNRPNIQIHVLDEAGIAYYPNGWKDWSDRVKSILKQKNVTPTVIFTSEPQDAERHALYYGCPVKLVDEDRSFMNISATKIRMNPYDNWGFIAKAARPFFVKRICIIGNKESGNLAQQFANFYNTEYISNGYINYIQRELNHKEHVLQEDDYINIALLHAQRLEESAYRANRYIFTDLDFVTLQSYFKTVFGHKNPLIDGLISHLSFDLTIDLTVDKKMSSRSAYFDTILEQVKSHLS
ncbi:multifunctional transcriptional regulator/nicotinamide-nucleotide adenylyltransferase/ribosylnicotinamide kinase NadR [Zophobihabitans entericus]|uniref:Multifunctional transcriptional regulator/nicotinamide-nucleotide adenylyltransferase/ribosylnicotinamide kinase NadR n=1 Tax=Zophobihabitans entericus TaxID=1635327 RepID=A0A6G9IEJ4_9GAMM|nr:multifunctional transcriptional regulator/nicotinamide-nucleotide adenylyltransferase/ribosylnicotinamide kinase NadR [Zophobihabitans entericus]QIQ22229.1 multifunctional transcriptional regulator/nicotinamide-nucleotide adenylyltransferase/ribosylnicotinamide kinase NadR [Zophobihabitans entericus]